MGFTVISRNPLQSQRVVCIVAGEQNHATSNGNVFCRVRAAAHDPGGGGGGPGRASLKRILFVCSGNTCRSPLAEAIARQVLPARLDFEVSIASAGTSAFVGSAASQHSVDIARDHGLDLTMHRSQPLTLERVHEMDLIVTMGVRHREVVGEIDPDSLECTYLLTNFSDRHHGDIPDPIGGGRDVYAQTYLVLRDCVEEMAAKLPAFDGWKKTRKTERDS